MVEKNRRILSCSYPHGFKVLLHPIVFVAGLIFAAMVIIPVSVLFELSKTALIFVVFMAAAIFAMIAVMLPERTYLVSRDGIVVVEKNQFFGKNQFTFSVDDVDQIEKLTESTNVLYVIPLLTDEVGIRLILREGDEVMIESANFHSQDDYRAVKRLLGNK